MFHPVDLIDNANRVLGTGTSNSNGVYTVQLSPNANLLNGTYTIRARAHGLLSSQGPVSAPVTVRLVIFCG